nr:MAK10-like protein [Tanacetum cinerariifolium]
MGDENHIRTFRDYSKPRHEGYMNTIELLIGNNVGFAKPVKENALPQDVPSTSDRRLIELKNQVQRLMEAHLASTQPTQVNKITTSCEICSGSHDTHYCMEDLEQAFVEYTSSRTDETGGSINTVTIHSEKQRDSYDEKAKENEEEEKDIPENIHVNPSTPPDPLVAFITEKVLKFNSFFESLELNDDSSEGEPEEEGSTTTEGVRAEYFDMFSTRSELAYHKYLMCSPIHSIFLRNPIITKGCPSNLKIPCNIGHVHVKKAYIDPNSPINIMTQMMYNWIIRRKLDPRENMNRGVSNFTGRNKWMHVFIENFTYVIDFMIVEDISSIIGPRLLKVVLRMPFVEIFKMTHDPPEGVVRLYLMRRSLEVLRKFYWTILEGRFK